MALVTVSFAACSKYDEGSKFTLLSKKSRAVNNWKLTSWVVDGVDNTILGSAIVKEVSLRDNGGATITSEFIAGFITTTDGSWAFNANKTHILLTNADGEVTSYKIIKLKKDELKVQYTSNSQLNVQEYVSK